MSAAALSHLRSTALVLLTLLSAVGVKSAGAVETAAARASTSLGELLDQVKETGRGNRELFEARVREFLAYPDGQQARLEQAESARADAERKSDELSDQFSRNELEINELNGKLSTELGQVGLAELFGVARQVAGDTAPVLEQSLISSQTGSARGESDRGAFLRQLAESRNALDTGDLQRLWLEIQEEITASGEVARYPATVVRPDGEAVQAEVTRIGGFIASAGGQFLGYLPTLQTLSVLPRQLPEPLMEVARRFETTSSGYVPAVVDPSRGVLLSLYVERPTFMERIELGETVGYIIILIGVLGAAAFLYQLVHLVVTRMRMSRQLKNPEQPAADNPLGRVLLAFKGDPQRIEESSEAVELRVTEAVMHEVPRLDRFQAFLRLAVAAGPLLGLIGTVVGMIITFQSITEAGSSDPRLMATGIGQAMIATVLGLGIAIPLLFANALLNTLSRGAVQVLEGQSIGILAETIEARQRA